MCFCKYFVQALVVPIILCYNIIKVIFKFTRRLRRAYKANVLLLTRLEENPMDVHPYAFRLFLPLQRIHKCGSQIIPFQFQRHFQFRAKYSTPEYRVVATTTQMTAQRKGWMWGNAIRRHRPTMVLAVFTLPDQPAAMTVPFPAATKRRPSSRTCWPTKRC